MAISQSVTSMALLATVALSSGAQSNLLWLMSDSFDGRLLDPGAPQWAQVALPNLRALADRGTNFIRTYANSPQCVPSRSSMMTGRHTHKIGAWSNSMGLAHRFNSSEGAEEHVDKGCKTAWNQSICWQIKAWQPNVTSSTPDILRGLRDAGVNVHVFGKVDIGFGILEDFAHATEDGFHGGAAMPVQTRSADIRGPTKENPTSITHTNVNNVHPEDWAMVDNCIDWLHSHDPSKDNWLMHCSLNIPHPPFQTNATWLQYVNDSAVGVPASFVNVSTMHAADAYAATSKNVDGHFSDLQIITTRRVYAAMCAETDYLFGRVLDAAEATGHLGAHTYILFNSDHGEMAMEHRQIWKNSMYEGSSRVPLVLVGPGVQPRRTVTKLTQLLDVFPTLIRLFGAPSAAGTATLDGLDLLDEAAIAGRTHIVSQYHSNMINTGTFMLRTADGYKYIAFGTSSLGLEKDSDYPPQLFDVEHDPDELDDLAAGGKAVEQVAKLDAILMSAVDYPAVDAVAKSVDHWLFDQWFVLAGHDQGGIEATWRKAYSTGRNFTEPEWEVEWGKAQRWMGLRLPRARRLTRRPIS